MSMSHITAHKSKEQPIYFVYMNRYTNRYALIGALSAEAAYVYIVGLLMTRGVILVPSSQRHDQNYVKLKNGFAFTVLC